MQLFSANRPLANRPPNNNYQQGTNQGGNQGRNTYGYQQPVHSTNYNQGYQQTNGYNNNQGRGQYNSQSLTPVQSYGQLNHSRQPYNTANNAYQGNGYGRGGYDNSNNRGRQQNQGGRGYHDNQQFRQQVPDANYQAPSWQQPNNWNQRDNQNIGYQNSSPRTNYASNNRYQPQIPPLQQTNNNWKNQQYQQDQQNPPPRYDQPHNNTNKSYDQRNRPSNNSNYQNNDHYGGNRPNYRDNNSNGGSGNQGYQQGRGNNRWKNQDNYRRPVAPIEKPQFRLINELKVPQQCRQPTQGQILQSSYGKPSPIRQLSSFTVQSREIKNKTGMRNQQANSLLVFPLFKQIQESGETLTGWFDVHGMDYLAFVRDGDQIMNNIVKEYLPR